MTSKKALMSMIAKRGRKLREAASSEVMASRTIRPKRPPGGYWSMEKLYIPVPLALKCSVMQLARENRMSLSEFGLIVMSAAVADVVWLEAVLKRR